MLAGAARGEMGSKGGGGQVRLSNVHTWELVGFFKLGNVFVLAQDSVSEVYGLTAPANTLVSLPLQLMKVTVLAESSNLLSFFIVICALQRCL